jgi:ubiquinone/menaquinone biosynthesis C-methylase UbiE
MKESETRAKASDQSVAVANSQPGTPPREDGDLAQRYQTWRNSTLGTITERLEMAAVLDFLGPLKGKRLLDAGCGDGTYALEVATRGALVTGVDLSEDMLAVARERSTARGIAVDWRQGDILALRFPDSSFDLAIAITLLCLVPDPCGAVRELSRVLVPGGKLVIGELHRWSAWAVKRRIRGWAGNKFWRGAHFWTASALRQLLADSGLRSGRTRGAIYYPPLGPVARVMAPVDPQLARLGTMGAAFLIVEGVKPV